jgi:hypothetical protein
MEAGTNIGTVVPWQRMGKDRQTKWDKFGQNQKVVWLGSLMLWASIHNDHPLHKLSTFKNHNCLLNFLFSLAQFKISL